MPIPFPSPPSRRERKSAGAARCRVCSSTVVVSKDRLSSPCQWVCGGGDGGGGTSMHARLQRPHARGKGSGPTARTGSKHRGASARSHDKKGEDRKHIGIYYRLSLHYSAWDYSWGVGLLGREQMVASGRRRERRECRESRPREQVLELRNNVAQLLRNGPFRQQSVTKIQCPGIM